MKSICRRALVIGLLLAAGLAANAPAAEKGNKKGGSSTEHQRSFPPPTTEPAPPLSLDLVLSTLQKNSSGGVASMSLKAGSSVALDEVRITLRAPAGVVFDDGSQERTWTSKLSAQEPFSFPFDLLISKDGKYVITGEATGQFEGRLLHRGISYKLLVGVREKSPQLKDGAIEYPGVPGKEK
jgi:hypothetical protein